MGICPNVLAILVDIEFPLGTEFPTSPAGLCIPTKLPISLTLKFDHSRDAARLTGYNPGEYPILPQKFSTKVTAKWLKQDSDDSLASTLKSLSGYTFSFLAFPIRPALACTIDFLQGKSLTSVAGFAMDGVHRWPLKAYYVLFSRCRTPAGLSLFKRVTRDELRNNGPAEPDLQEERAALQQDRATQHLIKPAVEWWIRELLGSQHVPDLQDRGINLLPEHPNIVSQILPRAPVTVLRWGRRRGRRDGGWGR